MKPIIKNTFLLIFLFSFSTIFSQETVKKYADNTLSSVTYAMSQPLHDLEGVNKNVRAVIKENSENGKIEKIAVSLKVVDFNSGNANRDSHAVEVLDGIKYPVVTFVSNKIEETGKTVNITGILKFHNVKREITVPVIKKEEKGKMFYSGTFDVDMTKFDIKQPSLMNVPTDKIIKVSFLLYFRH